MTATLCPAPNPLTSHDLGSPLALDEQAIQAELDAPDDRDWDVHEAVQVLGMSQRQAARQFQLSQPRIRQIVRRVEAWTRQMSPNDGAEVTPQQRRVVADVTHRRRLDYFYSQALRAWERSQGEQTQTRVTPSEFGGPPRTVTRTFTSCGNPIYLTLALKISERIAKLDGVELNGGAARRRNDRRESWHAEPATEPVASGTENRLSPAADTSTEFERTNSPQPQNGPQVKASGKPATAASLLARSHQNPLIAPSHKQGATQRLISDAEFDALFESGLKELAQSK